MKTRWLWVLCIAVVVGLVFILPIRSRDCPAWDVWVTDQTGQPVSGIKVRLICRNYSAERRSYESDAITDEKGYVAFKPRTISKSLGQRAIVTLLSAAAGPHASFGPHATVFAFNEQFEGSASQGHIVVDWTGQPDHMESHIVVMPRKAAHAQDESYNIPLGFAL